MAFTPKDWQDLPSTATPLSAVALEDLETRTTGYADTRDAELVANVKSFGAIGDGVNDDTEEIQAAIDAAAGRIVWFPAGCYKFSSLSLTTSTSLRGVGFWTNNNDPFGTALYLTPANYRGTVLMSTATSGSAIYTVHPPAYKLDIRDMVIVGPGSGTSVGLRIGDAAGTSGIGQSRFSNVLVLNFSTGWHTTYCIDGRFDTCGVRGCQTGFDIDKSLNNFFWNTEVQFTSVYGLKVGSPDPSTNCNFNGGLLQNISGTAGVRVFLNSSSCKFSNFWVEGLSATNSFVFDVQTYDNHWVNNRYSGNVTDLGSVSGSNCRIGPLYSQTSTKTLTITGNQTTVDNVGRHATSGTLVDTGWSTEKIGFSRQVLHAWLADNAQGPVTLGYIPQYAIVQSVGIWVEEAFNSDGTDEIRIGGTGDAARYCAYTDVSTTGNKTPAAPATPLPRMYTPGDAVVANYANGGSEPTTGKAVVWIEFFPIKVTPT